VTRVTRTTAVVASVILAAGCGGSGGEGAADEATSVLENLKSLDENEIVIVAWSSRTFGPFTFEPGGYVLRFEHKRPRGSLEVTLEPERDAGRQAYTALAETTDASGQRKVAASGKLRVRVRNTGGTYELRFTRSRSG
jgi:hypothetical protein